MNTLVKRSLAAMARMRGQSPRVHCITNSVAQHFTANVLLACGAIPSMTIAVDEIGEFSARADALLVNLGTMDPARTRAIYKAVETVNSRELPFVLDPVFVQASGTRLALARELAGLRPAIIRANAAEAEALFGLRHSGFSVEQLTAGQASCLAITGKTDIVIGNDSRAELSNGAELMARTTAMGCSLTALMAALAAVEQDRPVAAGAALLWFNIAGELAAEKSAGPGSFVPHFLDALANMDEATIRQRAKVS